MTAPRLVLMVILTIGLLALSLAGEAQPSGKIYRVGVLLQGRPPSGPRPFFDAFRQELADLGYAEGKNIVFQQRWEDGLPERLSDLAKELADLPVDVLVTPSTAAAASAKRVTTTTPIVFLVGDAVATGLVSSLSRPGGNITGVSNVTGDLNRKKVALLKEASPGLRRLVVLVNPSNPIHALHFSETEAAARSLGLTVHRINAQTFDELEHGLTRIEPGPSAAVAVFPDGLFYTERKSIAAIALRKRLVSMGFSADEVKTGAFMSYGENTLESARRLARYVDRILKGAKPADLPVEQPTKFELVINMRTAKALGLTIPQSVLLQADEVIE